MHTLTHTHTHMCTLSQTDTHTQVHTQWDIQQIKLARTSASHGVMRVNLPYKLSSKHWKTRIKLYILYILYEFHTLHIRANELINQLQLPLQLQIVYGKYANNYNQFKVVLTFLTCCRLTISQLLLWRNSLRAII